MEVLIAEDGPGSRLMLETTLSKWGYVVVVCSDGPEAWRALQREGAPGLALIDWMMPGMDGVEICRKVRESPLSQHMYVILLTVRESKRDVAEGLKAGADDYITKPFDEEELRARGGVAVGSGRSRERARRRPLTSQTAPGTPPDLLLLQEYSRPSRPVAAA